MVNIANITDTPASPPAVMVNITADAADAPAVTTTTTTTTEPVDGGDRCSFSYLFKTVLGGKNNNNNNNKTTAVDDEATISVTTTTPKDEERGETPAATTADGAQDIVVLQQDSDPAPTADSSEPPKCVFEETYVVAPDNKTALAILDSAKKESFLRHWYRVYMEIWKANLSGMVVLTAYVGRAITNAASSELAQPQQQQVITVTPTNSSNNNDVSSVDTSSNPIVEALKGLGKALGTEILFGLGTFLLSGAAISVNQIYERDLDKKMSRTRNRPIPAKRISVAAASASAVVAASTGAAMLYYGCNPMTAALGVSNFVIYTAIYTPLKVHHWTNTWFGAIVGALPPVMGCTSVNPRFGALTAKNDNSTAPALIWGGILFLWQITHFMALSVMCQSDYKQAGYKMLGILCPPAGSMAALSHCALMVPLCLAAPYYGVAHWSFAGISTAVNAAFLQRAIQFNRQPRSPEKARKLFYASLLHMCVLSVALTFTAPKVTSWIKDGVSSLAGIVGRGLLGGWSFKSK